jgi:formate dehydrogenase major subunit
MFDAACADIFKGMYIQGEDLAQSDPNTLHVEEALSKMECIVVQDLFLNETAKFAHVFLPGTSFLEKDGTFTNAERRINRVRPVMPPRQGKDEWKITQDLAQALGYDMSYETSAQIMEEIAELTPTFTNVSFELLDRVGSVQWPCNETAPFGTPIMHVDGFVRGKGLFVETEYVPTEERSNRKFPLLLTTGRILSQYNVGAQTRRTENNVWHPEDLLEIHPSDAETRGIREGDLVSLASRKGEITLKATVTERVQPGVVYTTFHNPATGANVVTTEHSDWATSCPEYKVTAVEVTPATHRSEWQRSFEERASRQGRILGPNR